MEFSANIVILLNLEKDIILESMIMSLKNLLRKNWYPLKQL